MLKAPKHAPSLAFLLFSVFATQHVEAIEQPEYKLIDEAGSLQIRQYEPSIVARTLVDKSFKSAGNEGFRRLARYIFGGNAESEKIAMTAPVAQVEHSGSPGGGRYWITFNMPKAYQLVELPEPEDARIEIYVEPSKTVAVVQYKGGWSKKKYQMHEEELLALVEASPDWIINGDITWARYDPPFVPWFMKTNEITVEVTRNNSEND